ncbi:MAG: glycosyltransferase family 39 protein [Solirubrobacteraceae bacterium]
MSVGSLTHAARPRAADERAGEARALLADRTLLVLGSLVVIAAFLRFYRLGHQGFWFDEGNTAQEVHFTVGQMLTLLKHYESTPPLYYGVAWVWAHVFGYGEVGLRSLSALMGVLAVPVAYGAAAKLISRRAGLIAAALVTFNPYLIWYSQEARAYSLAVLLAGAGLMAFAFARANPSWKAMAAWAVISGLALTTEYYALLVVIPEALWLLYLHRRRRELWWSLAGLAVWTAPLLWFAISQNATGHASWIAPLPLGPRLGQVIPQFLVGYGGPALTVMQRVAEATALVGIVLLFTRSDPRERPGALVAGGIALAGVVLNLLLIAGGVDDLITRNAIELWMPAAIALAGGLAAARARAAGLVATVVLCGIGVTMAGAVSFDRTLQRPDWRKLARLLGERPPAGGRVLLVQRYRTLLPLSLYLPGLKFLPGLSIQPGEKVPPGLQHGSATAREFDVVAVQAPRVDLCWWGATCNLTPSHLETRYPVKGFRVLWRRSVYPFTVERFVAVGGSSTITASQAWFGLGARPHIRSGGQVETGNEVLVQR